MFKKFFLLIVLFSFPLFAQNNLLFKPLFALKFTWSPINEPGVFQYGVFYVQGTDTTLFPFNTGTNPDSLWYENEPVSDWMYAATYDRYFYVEPKKSAGTFEVTYLRLGVCAINSAGQYGLIQCIPKVIRLKTPGTVIDVKTY